MRCSLASEEYPDNQLFNFDTPRPSVCGRVVTEPFWVTSVYKFPVSPPMYSFTEFCPLPCDRKYAILILTGFVSS